MIYLKNKNRIILINTSFILLLLTVSLFTFLPHIATADITEWGLPEGAMMRLGKGEISGNIAYSPDGTRLAVSSSVGIWIYDSQTLQELNLISGHTKVYCVSFSPDGQTIASGSNDATVRLWDVETGIEKRRFIGHTGGVLSVNFSPDGKTIASGGLDGFFRLWDIETGIEKPTSWRASEGAFDWVDNVSFSPDGKTIAMSTEHRFFHLSDVENGRLRRIRRIIGHTDRVVSLSFSPDGKTVVSGSKDETVRLWDVETGTEKQRFIGHTSSVLSVSFSPDGKTVASAARDGTIRLWDVQTGIEKQRLKDDSIFPNRMSFSPDGKTIVNGSWDDIVRLWDVQTGIERQRLIGHTNSINSVSISPDGKTIAGSDWNGVYLWDVQTGIEKQRLIGHRHWVNSVSFSPDGKTIAGGGSNGVYLWNVQTGVIKQKFTESFTGGQFSVDSLSFSPDGNSIAGVVTNHGPFVGLGRSYSSIFLWDIETGIEKQVFGGHIVLGEPTVLLSVSFSPDGKTIASGGRDGTVRMWDVETRVALMWNYTKDAISVDSLSFSPDGKTIASGDWHGTVRMWDAQTGIEIRRFIGHTDWVVSLSFSPDGKTVASGGRDGTVRMWDVETGIEIRRLIGHTGQINSVSFSPDGQTIASGSEDGTVLLWRVMPKDDVTFPFKVDVNGDGTVNIQDLVSVAAKLGQTGISSADVNGDGVVNIQDLVLIAAALGTDATAPSLNPQTLDTLTAADIRKWLSAAQQLNLKDVTSHRGVLFLQQLLVALTPKKTVLLTNYPNPFNPETWIPYHLSKDADVTLHIYAMNGTLVRTLRLGHQAAGMYQKRSRAAYWDGKNEIGESVTSGIYFYTLSAGDFTATRKMLILK